MRKKKYLIIIAFFLYLMSCNDSSYKKLLGKDYRLFEYTQLATMAEAVNDEDIIEIEEIIKESSVNLDYQEPRFGKTLLMLSVLNNDYKSAKKLLELGADPNLHDNYTGESAMISSAGINGIKNDNTKFLKLMLKFGGNPNDVEIGGSAKNTSKITPLIMAVSKTNHIVSPIYKVKLLVKSGANINYKNEFGDSPLRTAWIHSHYDVVLFLLNNGADFKNPLFIREGKEYFLWDELRSLTLELDTKEYSQKMAIVSFLESKGINYRSLPIPDYVIVDAKRMYPDSWKDYLNKY